MSSVQEYSVSTKNNLRGKLIHQVGILLLKGMPVIYLTLYIPADTDTWVVCGGIQSTVR